MSRVNHEKGYSGGSHWGSQGPERTQTSATCLSSELTVQPMEWQLNLQQQNTNYSILLTIFRKGYDIVTLCIARIII